MRPAPNGNGNGKHRPFSPEKEVFTTGEVARICRVTAPTAIKWIDSGKLPGYRIPMSRERRVVRKELVRFMKENHIPTDALNDAEGREKRILVVDDEPDITEVLEATLRSKGYDVKTAANGMEAGMMVSEFHPGVVLLDIRLPGLNGREVCKTLKKSPGGEEIRVIALSACVEAKEEPELKELGFEAFLRKPFRIAALLALLEEQPA